MPAKEFQVIIDTREQAALEFPSREITTVRETLDVGDYAVRIKGNSQPEPIRIERKSVSDLFGSFSGDNYRREKDKINRAKSGGLRYILAIEASASQVRKGYQYFKDGRWHESGKPGLTQVRQLETISLKYGVGLRYCASKDDMAFVVQEILLAYVRNSA